MSRTVESVTVPIHIEVPVIYVDLQRVVCLTLRRLMQYKDAIYRPGRDIDGINPEGDGLLIAENQVIDVCGSVVAEAIYRVVEEDYGTTTATDAANVIYPWQKQGRSLTDMIGRIAVSFADDSVLSAPFRLTSEPGHTLSTLGLCIQGAEHAEYGRLLLETIGRQEAAGTLYGEILEHLQYEAKHSFQQGSRKWLQSQLDRAESGLLGDTPENVDQ